MAVWRTRSPMSLLFLVMMVMVLLPAMATVSRRPGAEPRDDQRGSLRGVLKALERRRRTPQGPYSLASYQDRSPQELLEQYLAASNGYRTDDLDRDAMLSYLEEQEAEDEDYPTDDPNTGYYRGTAFRERNDRMKLANAKKISAFRERELKNHIQPDDLFSGSFEKRSSDSGRNYLKKLSGYDRRLIQKRQLPGEYSPSGGWGPIAFKRKRSSNQRVDNNDAADFLYSLKFVSQADPSAVENLKDDKMVDEEEDSDIATIINDHRNQPSKYNDFDIPSPPQRVDEDLKSPLQPLTYNLPEDMYLPDGSEIVTSEGFYPINKRSNAPISREANKNKQFRSSFNDAKVAHDLSSIFGMDKSDESKSLKKRSSGDDNSHEAKSPTISAIAHNGTKDSKEDEKQTHSRHEHDNKPPMMTSNTKEFDHSHEGSDKKVSFEDGDQETHVAVEHPIIVRKKSIDWSQYFGIDRRKKKSMMPMMMMNQETNNAHVEDEKHKKTATNERQQSKLDKMENKIKSMESVIVDEALDFDPDDLSPLDTKEEQETKGKLLSRLAAAYSLEKMRKAIQELRYTLKAQKDEKHNDAVEDVKEKRSSDNKITSTTATGTKSHLDLEDFKALIDDNYFQNEQGAGNYLNGPMDSDGNKLSHLNENDASSCPILDRIVRRCHNVDILAANHGRLFMPLCSLHQICYLCGPSSRTGCDLIFLSEADSACDGHARCQRAARTALMSLRELHEPLAHHLQGECSKDTCLARPLLDNESWHQAFRR